MQNYVTSFSGHWSCPTGMSSFGFFQVFGTLDVAAQRKDFLLFNYYLLLFIIRVI